MFNGRQNLSTAFQFVGVLPQKQKALSLILSGRALVFELLLIYWSRLIVRNEGLFLICRTFASEALCG